MDTGGLDEPLEDGRRGRTKTFSAESHGHRDDASDADDEGSEHIAHMESDEIGADETPREVIEQLEEIFEADDGIQQVSGNDLNRVFTLRDPLDSKVFFKSTVKADGPGPAAKKVMSIELDRHILPVQINKLN